MDWIVLIYIYCTVSIELESFLKQKEEQAVFDCQKRFPGKDTNGDYYPGLRGIVRIPLSKFEKEKEVEELIKFTKDEDVV